MSISLTEKAAERAQKYLVSRGKGIGLKLGVKTTGCSGMAYTLEFVDDILPEDKVYESHGIKILVDPNGVNSIELGAYGVPETLLVHNNSKTILKKYIGPLDDKKLAELKMIIKNEN